MAITRIFIDSRVNDKELLISQFAPGTDYQVLDANRDGIEQMVTALSGRSGYDSIQIISHGASGSITIGATVLNSSNLDFYAAELALLGNALNKNGDLLLYGCSVAAGDQGKHFIETLSHITGADVAASDDPTGSTLAGGDWSLEAHSGAIEAENPFGTQNVLSWQGTLAWYDNISNLSLKNLVIQDLSDNLFSFEEVLTLLSAAAQGGVTSTEFNDLKLFYQNSTTLFSSDYLRYISDAVINGNPANQTWWGAHQVVPRRSLSETCLRVRQSLLPRN